MSSSSKQSNNFQTPVNKRFKPLQSNESPFTLPPTPCMKQLGSGTGVNVYLLERTNSEGVYSSPWAVKKTNSKLAAKDSEYEKRLQREGEILKNLNHPNIIGFRKYAKTKDGSTCLVMESGETALSTLIEDRADASLGPFEEKTILKVAHSIASALKYLHEECHILHGDIKSPNILVKGDFDNIKLCDFGVSLKLNKSLVAECKGEYYIGSECWSAAETLIGDTISHKTDMFSYGLVLWEMMSLTIPHLVHLDVDDSILDGMTDEELVNKLQNEKEEVFQKHIGTRPELPEDLPSNLSTIIDLFEKCTEQSLYKRPSAAAALKLLTKK